jgi:hypothetical protein
VNSRNGKSEMEPFAPVARKFISAVWRRIVFVRIAESMAISAAVASAAGLAIVPILWWRGESAFSLAIGMLGLGCFFGAIWGISRRPTRLQAAIEADSQLGLHDLLGTVVLFDKSETRSPWENSIAAFADEHCRTLRPSAIIVNRIGLRGWAGVGILGALLLTFALFTARPTEATAATSALGSIAADSPNATNTVLKNTKNSLPSSARPPGPGGIDDNSIRSFQQDRPDDSNAGLVAEKNSTNHSSGGLNLSTGSGAATTHNPISYDSRLSQDGAGKTAQTGLPANGLGQPDPRINAAGENNSTGASIEGVKRTAPWESVHWRDDGNAAREAISAGRVPEIDADLVRDYFRRD